MLITKRRIRSLKSNIGNVVPGTKFVMGIKNIERYGDTLEHIGFTENLEIGETVLPMPQGSASEYNANGKYLKHKDQPKETIYKTREWTREQWAGRGQTETVTDFVEFSYKRYPRTFMEPPSIEFTIASTTNGDKLITAPVFEYNGNDSEFIHIINLFLELFGECQLFHENLDEIIKPPINRLNWEILPQGPIPWQQVSRIIMPIIDKAPKSNRPVILDRIETIENFNPDFRAFGKAGFGGYIVFGFEEKNLFIFESIKYGNATYIFDNNWEELSQKTKAEILDNDLHKARIVHRINWGDQIKELFNDLGIS
ncbi:MULTISPECIES: hypothetical protein [Methanobacterium]|uniref:Uncharacterized protein n=1 Tax=Methanobacterium bryantii TaxID=2161 RepID=A0A2A2H946_METBR|nr:MULTISPECIES: hypothetical protein [Methanobacterium]OEC85690.1 hypothetical protein A9507_13115 [Methanobacterium sp. A39]PAV05875.1 hypothetical protein ASJ80_13505 [Methanobacterium bryantii]